MTVDAPLSLTPELTELLASVPETHPITTEEISYTDGDTAFAGYIARPVGSEAGVTPGILLISDWTGLNDHVRVRAQMLARMGYIALAGDIYGGGLQVDGPDAAAEAGKYYGDTDLFRSRVRSNFDHLLGVPGVDTDRTVVAGYCFGGSATLELARSGADAAGFVTFHGGLATGAPAAEGSIQSPILVLTGAADPVVPDEAVLAFENELRDAKAPDWQVVNYSGALHAFAVPGVNAPEHGAQFDARANARSWVAFTSFLDEVVGAR